MAANFVRFHTNKTDFWSKVQNPHKLHVKLSFECMAKNLGVTFDYNLTFIDHARKITQACFYQLKNIQDKKHAQF